MTRMLLAAAACAWLAVPTVARDDKAAVGYVKLVQVESGKVLSIADGSDESEARVVLAKEDEKDLSQQWKLEKDGTFYKLINRKSSKVLDVNNASNDEGAAIIQWESKDDDYDNQRWSWDGDGKDRRLKSKSSGHVLDVDDEGKAIQKKADPKAKGQLWKVVEVKK